VQTATQRARFYDLICSVLLIFLFFVQEFRWSRKIKEDIMLQTTVTVTLRKVSLTACVVEIGGEMTAAAETALMDVYTRATSLGARLVVLNFSQLAYMNSSGIGLLVALLMRAKRHQQRLLAVGLSAHYKQIFDLTRLNEAICMYDSEDEALVVAGA
jgi:anti-sigma B factor antagonist